MKKIGYLILAIFCLSAKNVVAECNLDLRTQAANVKTNYVMSEIVLDEFGNEVTNISVEEAKKDIEAHQVAENVNTSKYSISEIVLLKIYNLTDKLYVTVNESKSNTLTTYHYQDSNNGEITIKVPDVDTIREYKVRVFSNDTSCLGEEISSPPSVKTPMYNPYSEYEVCLNQSKYYCQPYVTTEITTNEEDIFNELYKDEAVTDEEEQVKTNYWKSLKVIIPFLTVLILLGAIGYIYFKKKGKK